MKLDDSAALENQRGNRSSVDKEIGYSLYTALTEIRRTFNSSATISQTRLAYLSTDGATCKVRGPDEMPFNWQHRFRVQRE